MNLAPTGPKRLASLDRRCPRAGRICQRNRLHAFVRSCLPYPEAIVVLDQEEELGWLMWERGRLQETLRRRRDRVGSGPRPSPGFTLIFGLMRISNLAHGGFYLVGGYFGITVALTTGNLWLGLLTGGLLIKVLGLFAERILLRPIRGLEKPEVLLTIGLTFVIGDISLSWWGGDPRTIPLPGYLKGAINVGDFFYPKYRLFVLAFAIVLGGTLF